MKATAQMAIRAQENQGRSTREGGSGTGRGDEGPKSGAGPKEDSERCVAKGQSSRWTTVSLFQLWSSRFG